MNENEMLQAILSEIKGMSSEIKGINSEIKGINLRLDSLEDGQKAIRRDVARVDQKIDRLSTDVGDTLVYITENVGTELDLLKKAR